MTIHIAIAIKVVDAISSKNIIPNVISKIAAIIPATIFGHLINSSITIENKITNNKPIIKYKISIR
jgi:putative flippase GtrA